MRIALDLLESFYTLYLALQERNFFILIIRREDDYIY